MKSISAALIVMTVASVTLPSFGQSWQEHGALKVSAERHTIDHADGTPFLWIADTGWGLFQQLKREEVDHYLDTRQAQGFTVIQTVAFWYPHGGGIPTGPHNATNAYGHRPFTGDRDHPNTAEPLIVTGGQPTQPNDYWDHADYIVEAVRRRHLVLALLPCWGRAYVTQEFTDSHIEFDATEAKAYGAFLGKRYRQEPHIVWVLGGDAKAQKESYDQRPVFRAMAEGLVQGVTGESPAWNEAHPAWDKLVLTYHPDGHVTLNSSSWFHQDAWLSANGVEVWGAIDQVYPVMRDEYRLTDPRKPSLFLEGSYEYGSYKHECGWVTPRRTRQQFYHTFFAGGAGHTYGAGPVWAMRGAGGGYSCGYTWRQALDFPGARQIARTGKAFLLEHHWPDWVPDQSVIAVAGDAAESRQTAVHTTKGRKTLVYFADTTPATVKNVLDAPCQAHWFDPRNGETKKAEAFDRDASRRVTPPNGWEDAILVLEAGE
jgi:hypothetical protein